MDGIPSPKPKGSLTPHHQYGIPPTYAISNSACRAKAAQVKKAFATVSTYRDPMYGGQSYEQITATKSSKKSKIARILYSNEVRKEAARIAQGILMGIGLSHGDITTLYK
ncbi:hypothetical protein G9A89_000233 [Geosiphon pyriformis]|nr:hypothetical protein G9A89_000233 [Geosiphon pyriformis]